MTNITTLRPGEHFMFKNFEWVCLDPNHPDGGVLAIMATPWTKDVKFCPSDKFTDEKGNWNNYRTSNVREILSDMANAVFEEKSLLPHTVDLVADNGDRAYGTVQDFVFILTCDEYRMPDFFCKHKKGRLILRQPLIFFHSLLSVQVFLKFNFYNTKFMIGFISIFRLKQI